MFFIIILLSLAECEVDCGKLGPTSHYCIPPFPSRKMGFILVWLDDYRQYFICIYLHAAFYALPQRGCLPGTAYLSICLHSL
uniref:Putative secreted protein n=1 Tax=Ixodes ricinus TaxID=34613 RepID=A0A6B0U6Y0_IXORI